MKIMKSYRWQLVTITLLTGTLAIAVFAAISWRLVLFEKYKQIDYQMKNFGSQFGAQIYAITISNNRRLFRHQALINETSKSGMAVYSEFQDNDVKSEWQSDDWPEFINTGDFSSFGAAYIYRRPLPPTSRHSPNHHNQPENQREQQHPPEFPSGPTDQIQGSGPNSHPYPPTPNHRRPGSNQNSHEFSQRQHPNLNHPMPAPADQLLGFNEIEYQWIEHNGKKYRLMIFPVHRGFQLYLLDLDTLKGNMSDLNHAYLIATPIALILILLSSIYVAQKAISPVKRLTSGTEKITAHALHRRISTRNEPAEFVTLIEVYNSMLTRLERSFLQARRFSSDAAHELNTPLTILQGQIDAALQEAEIGSREQEQYSELLEEVKRLNDIVDKLLILSRADSGRLSASKSTHNISDQLDQLIEDYQLMWENHRFVADIEPEVYLYCDATMIRQILANLISNACRYNHEQGKVKVELRKSSECVSILVTNTGTPIPPKAEERLFDRFYRADPSRVRNNSHQGLGLGLSLSQEFTHAHGGKLSLICNELDKISFSLTLPFDSTD